MVPSELQRLGHFELPVDGDDDLRVGDCTVRERERERRRLQTVAWVGEEGHFVGCGALACPVPGARSVPPSVNRGLRAINCSLGL
eukprot:2841736-Prymnesium_polylepis.1